jgi:hypothetical protein
MTGIGSPARYEVHIQGVVDAAWFEGLRVVSDGRRTAISGLLPDQSALHGLLVKIRDLGLCVTGVRRLDPSEQ